MAGELLFAYNRSDQIVYDPWALTRAVTGAQWSSVVPGGFEKTPFNMRAELTRELIERQAFRVAWKYGMGTCWEGRLSDLERRYQESGGSDVGIVAYGGWEHMKQRRLSAVLTAAAGEHADDLLYRALANCPLLSTDYTYLQDPGLDLGAMSWPDGKDVQSVVMDILKKGDTQTPPRQWYFAVWQAIAVKSAGAIDQSVAASADDAQDIGGDSDNSYTAATIKLGEGAGGDAYSYTGGLRWQNVAIPRYAHIVSATLYLYSGGWISNPYNVRFTIRGELSGNAAAFSASWPRTRTPTTASLEVDLTEVGNWVNGTWYNYNVMAQVQEMVNQSTWSSGNAMAMILTTLAATSSSARIQMESWDAASTHRARLVVTFSQPTGQTMALVPYFFPRPTVGRSTANYAIRAKDVVGSFTISPDLTTLCNSVRAKYGALYTAAAEDATSIAKYDKRENDPEQLDAGSTATLAQAEVVRDLYLAMHKDPIWKATDITVRRLYTRDGMPVHPGMARAGSIIWLPDFPTFDPSDTVARTFYVAHTNYDRDKELLTLSPEVQPDTLDILLARMKET